MDEQEVAGIAAAAAWSRVGACRAGTPEWEIALAEWEITYSAWRVTVALSGIGYGRR